MISEAIPNRRPISLVPSSEPSNSRLTLNGMISSPSGVGTARRASAISASLATARSNASSPSPSRRGGEHQDQARPGGGRGRVAVTADQGGEPRVGAGSRRGPEVEVLHVLVGLRDAAARRGDGRVEVTERRPPSRHGGEVARQVLGGQGGFDGGHRPVGLPGEDVASLPANYHLQDALLGVLAEQLADPVGGQELGVVGREGLVSLGGAGAGGQRREDPEQDQGDQHHRPWRFRDAERETFQQGPHRFSTPSHPLGPGRACGGAGRKPTWVARVY